MMTKMQKKLLWLFGAMFLIPEILFSFILISIINFSNGNIKPLYSLIINEQFFIDNTIYLILFMFIEWIGILGLLILNIRLNKKLIATLLGIILLWMTFIIFVGYIISASMSFP